jgi:acetyl-CoA carboxylase carboxyltransferase component
MQDIRKLLSFLPSNWREHPTKKDTGDDPERFTDALAKIVPEQTNRAYDMHKVIKEIVDNGDFFEIKREFAAEIIVGFARLWMVIASACRQSADGTCQVYSVDSSDKQARFIRFRYL